MIGIRYYADDFDEQRHERKIKLLNEIYNRHGIPVEIIRVQPKHGSISTFRGTLSIYPRKMLGKETFLGIKISPGI